MDFHFKIINYNGLSWQKKIDFSDKHNGLLSIIMDYNGLFLFKNNRL